MAAQVYDFLLFTSLFCCKIAYAAGQSHCESSSYMCDKGHCCGHGRCCTYYYELWWFWVLWMTIALIVGCCYYQQKRLRKHAFPFLPWARRSQRSRSSRSGSRSRSRSRSRASTQSAPPSSSGNAAVFSTPVFDPDKMLRLPTYDEITRMPKDPPAYDILYTSTNLPNTLMVSQPDVEAADQPLQHTVEVNEVDESPRATLLDNEVACDSNETMVAVPTDAPPPPYTLNPEEEIHGEHSTNSQYGQ